MGEDAGKREKSRKSTSLALQRSISISANAHPRWEFPYSITVGSGETAVTTGAFRRHQSQST